MRTLTIFALATVAFFAGCEQSKPTNSPLASERAAQQQPTSQLDFLNNLSGTISKLADQLDAIKTVDDLDDDKDNLLSTLGSIETMIEEFQPDLAAKIEDPADVSQVKSTYRKALSDLDVAVKGMPIEVRQTDFVRQELSREFTKLGNSLKSLGRKAAEQKN